MKNLTKEEINALHSLLVEQIKEHDRLLQQGPDYFDQFPSYRRKLEIFKSIKKKLEKAFREDGEGT